MKVNEENRVSKISAIQSSIQSHLVELQNNMAIKNMSDEALKLELNRI